MNVSRRPTSQTPVVLAVHPGGELYGSDRMFAESVRAFVEQGCHVVAVLGSGGPLRDLLLRHGAECVVTRMPVLRKSALAPRGFVDLVGTGVVSLGTHVRLLRRHRPDVVYVSTQTIPSWVVAGRLSGTRTVCHVHEAERHAARLVELGLNLPLLGAEVVIVNSSFARSVLAEVLPRLGARTAVVLNGVASPHRVSPARASVDGPLRVLFVGRLSPRKGPDVAIEAVHRLARSGLPVRLRLLGSAFHGYEWFEQRLREQAAAMPTPSSVELLGFRRTVWDELEGSDVVVVPSTSPEPFGNTAVEARLAARPVVASDCGGLPEALAGCASARLVPPGDAQALADVIGEMVADWERLRALAVDDAVHCADQFAPAAYRARVAATTLGQTANRRHDR